MVKSTSFCPLPLQIFRQTKQAVLAKQVKEICQAVWRRSHCFVPKCWRLFLGLDFIWGTARRLKSGVWNGEFMLKHVVLVRMTTTGSELLSFLRKDNVLLVTKKGCEVSQFKNRPVNNGMCDRCTGAQYQRLGCDTYLGWKWKRCQTQARPTPLYRSRFFSLFCLFTDSNPFRIFLSELWTLIHADRWTANAWQGVRRSNSLTEREDAVSVELKTLNVEWNLLIWDSVMAGVNYGEKLMCIMKYKLRHKIKNLDGMGTWPKRLTVTQHPTSASTVNGFQWHTRQKPKLKRTPETKRGNKKFKSTFLWTRSSFLCGGNRMTPFWSMFR